MQKKKKLLNEEKEKGKVKKEERTGGVRPHGGAREKSEITKILLQ
jgi:hypothetical protein